MTEKDHMMLHRLETLRRTIEASQHEAGSLYDYLDRGRPDADQKFETWVEINQQRQASTEAHTRLAQLVSYLRQHSPALIDLWVDTHQAIYREIQRLGRAGRDPMPLEPYVSAQALAAWEQVRTGQREFVIGNGYVMRHHQDLITKHFGF